MNKYDRFLDHVAECLVTCYIFSEKLYNKVQQLDHKLKQQLKEHIKSKGNK